MSLGCFASSSTLDHMVGLGEPQDFITTTAWTRASTLWRATSSACTWQPSLGPREWFRRPPERCRRTTWLSWKCVVPLLKHTQTTGVRWNGSALVLWCCRKKTAWVSGIDGPGTQSPSCSEMATREFAATQRVPVQRLQCLADSTDGEVIDPVHHWLSFPQI